MVWEQREIKGVGTAHLTISAAAEGYKEPRGKTLNKTTIYSI